MAMTKCDHVVYMKDGKGNAYPIGESVFQDHILQHPPMFSQVPKILKELQDFQIRMDDVWLIDYPKSGKDIIIYPWI